MSERKFTSDGVPDFDMMWRVYRAMVIPPHATDDDVETIRKVFFDGAWWMWQASYWVFSAKDSADGRIRLSIMEAWIEAQCRIGDRPVIPTQHGTVQ